MQPKETKIQIQRTRRYFTAGNPQASQWWVLLHGFGQMPQYFIRHFEPFYENQYFIAPEGLHRQYLKGTNGRVGASWMTKEAREDDIQDNLLFLDRVVGQCRGENQPQVDVLGFSQGASTAARWAVCGETEINRVILHSGVFPPDMKLTVELTGKGKMPGSWHLITGDKDPYPRSENYGKRFEEFVTYMGAICELQIYEFYGEHALDMESVGMFMV